ncbi:A/G-specific adenine glycosylase [Candidatus Methylocalor cossyra]|uniref:Adenine DNA glycosylase n=1 Tax=Candidatus Methylocalor cossyra TaxID=3108543 RepID=A0ABM9NIW3_9GAMM
MQVDEFQAALLAWFDRHGRRHLPWQTRRDPYRVWISEIMLQQTQVATVIPYFERFTARFPDVATLAQATPDEVIALWSGLGYYTRARHLHRAARALMERHGGALPPDLAALTALPGIGRSTAGAILSLGFGIRAAILDGNVKRVLARYAGIREWPGRPQVERALWQLSERYTPVQRVADFNQAMMDLGATLCLRHRPACAGCPLEAGCTARRLGLTERIPGPRPRRVLPVRRRFLVLLVNDDGEVYLEKRAPLGVWGGLFSLPEFASEEELASWCRQWSVDPTGLERLPQRRHTFSHFHLDFVPVLGRGARIVPGLAEAEKSCWIRPERATAVPAPVQRLLREIAGGVCPTVGKFIRS